MGGYLGPSSVTMSKDQFLDESKYRTTINNPTWKYGPNIIISRNNFGFVLAYGWEKATGKNGHQWIYNNKSYSAFGINTGFGR